MPYKIPRCKDSGIYVITNLKTGRVYVGSAIALRGRMLCHRASLRRGVHDNSYLQRAWDKCGEGSFIFKVLEVCQPQECLVREQYWIDQLRAAERAYGYNLCPFAGGGRRGMKFSKETRDKMSRTRKGIVPVAATEAAAIANKGKSRPPEVCNKIGDAQRGRVMGPEFRKKIRATHWSKKLTKRQVSEIMRNIGRKGLVSQGKYCN